MGPGPWQVSAGVDPHNVQKAIELVRAEIEKITTVLVEEDELADSKANFIGRLPLSLETNSGVASGLTHIERYQLGLDYYRRYADLINSISREQILETAAKYLSASNLGIAFAGPEDIPQLEN
jgi:zinc protease